MHLEEREKRAVVGGSVLGVAILVFAYGILPLMRAWSYQSAQLAPKQEYVKALRQRLNAQQSLMARRAVLAKRIGSLLGSEGDTDRSVSEKDTLKNEVPDQSVPADDQTGLDETATGTPEPEQTDSDTATKPISDTATVSASDVRVAAYIERTIQRSGMKIKRLTPKSTSSGRKNNKHFHPVAIQVSVEGDIERLLNLLYALEKGDRFVRIDQFQCRRDWNKGNAVNATLDVLAYETNAG
ncbi:MAG: hypothetical protein J7M12_00285 [Candidatus Hydrogenedentes bacterium]|nr:hypothetical protein [Candidatus Hydrogenedentota bacterium]